MSPPSRTAQFAKLHKVLKKYYKPFAPDEKRSVLEHLLFACCLENAHYEAAEESFLALVHNFFDWNEVRVSTVRELSEVMGRLPEPAAAAGRVKNALQSVFETNYSFDLEDFRKMNLGPATERIMKLKGATPFVGAYVVQAALGGHSIPIDAGTVGVLRLLDLATDDDVKACAVQGLERAIAKNKGVEFGSLLHQLGADFTANPYAPALHEILLEINPDIRDRLPKRRKPGEEAARAAAEVKPSKKAAEKTEGRTETPAGEKPQGKPKRAPAKKKPGEAKVEPAKGKAVEGKAPEAKVPEGKAPEGKAAKSAAEKPAERKKGQAEAKEAPAAKKKPGAKKGTPAKTPPAKRKDAEKGKTHAESGKKAAGKEPGSSGLAKRKPR